jgi:hypothetical protein
VAHDRLSQDEVAMVLRRAAQLDGETAARTEERLPVTAVESAAAEVGLAPAAVRRAVNELRAGVLAGPVDAVADPRTVIQAAVVPLDRAGASIGMGRWLAAQTFRRHRGRDGVEVWRVREDWLAGMQRRFDWSASVRLKWVHEVVVRLVAVEGGTLVHLEASLVPPAGQSPAIGAATGAVTGAASGVAIVAASGGGAVLMAAGAVATGVGAASGWWAGRAVRRSSCDRVADELAAALDRLAAGGDQRWAIGRLRDRTRRRQPRGSG